MGSPRVVARVIGKARGGVATVTVEEAAGRSGAGEAPAGLGGRGGGGRFGGEEKELTAGSNRSLGERRWRIGLRLAGEEEGGGGEIFKIRRLWRG